MAPAAPAAGPKFTWGGLVDAYYMFNFIRQDVAGVTADTLTPPAARAFDTNSNSATMSLAALSLNAAMDPVTFQLDFGYGATGTIINAAASNPPVTPPGMNTTTPPSFVLLQAYGSVAVAPMVTLDFGKFYTTAGAEVIPANKNWLYSRSLLFNSIPLLHTGARANIKVNDMLTLQASVVNGWNDDPDVNAWKTFGASASITPNKMATIVATTYIGKEGPQAAGETSGDLRVLIDAVLALTLSDKLGINFNVDYIKAPANIAADYLIGGAGMRVEPILRELEEFVEAHRGDPGASRHVVAVVWGLGWLGYLAHVRMSAEPAVAQVVAASVEAPLSSRAAGAIR